MLQHDELVAKIGVDTAENELVEIDDAIGVSVARAQGVGRTPSLRPVAPPAGLNSSARRSECFF